MWLQVAPELSRGPWESPGCQVSGSYGTLFLFLDKRKHSWRPSIPRTQLKQEGPLLFAWDWGPGGKPAPWQVGVWLQSASEITLSAPCGCMDRGQQGLSFLGAVSWFAIGSRCPGAWSMLGTC